MVYENLCGSPSAKCVLGGLLLIHLLGNGDSFDLTIPALGRKARLGEFYDARKLTFSGVTIFQDTIPPKKLDETTELIETFDSPNIHISQGIVDSDTSRMFHLNVNAEVKVEMMCGKLKATGSAAYFSEEKSSAMEVEGFLFYGIRTKSQFLNILFNRIQPYLKLDTLDKVEATHIVIGIDYGADTVIQFLKKVDNKTEQSKIRGALDLELFAGTVSISAAANASIKHKMENKSSEFDLSVHSDLHLGSMLPQIMKNFIDVVPKIDEKIKEYNGGKGVPKIYYLLPISILSKLLSTAKIQQKVVNDLSEAVLKDLMKKFEKIASVQQELNDLETNFKYYSNCVSEDDIGRLAELNVKFSATSLQFKSKVEKAMDAARAMTTPTDAAVENPVLNLQQTEASKTEAEGYDSQSQAGAESQENENASTHKRSNFSQIKIPDLLVNVLIDYQTGEYSVENVTTKLSTDFQYVRSKIELYKVFQQLGVVYFGRHASFTNFRLRTKDEIIFAIFMIDSDGSEWNRNWELFINNFKTSYNVLVVVDCDFEDVTCTSVESEKATVMHQYYNNRLISHDVYADLTKNAEKPPLTVSSVGRFHGIGNLYNAHNHQFTGKSLLLPGTNLTKINMTTENFSNETIKIVSNRFEGKFSVMNVQPPALQYQILLNPNGFQGVGKTFAETRGFQPGWISSTLYHVYNTVSESILDMDGDPTDFISISQLFKGGATHFVKKIVWGGQTTISLSAPLPSDEENYTNSTVMTSESKAKDLLSKLHEDLDNIWDIFKFKLNPEVWEVHGKITEIPLSPLNYEMTFASDISQNGQNEFRNEKDLVNFLNEFPHLKLKSNNGKGRPLIYVLYPLENLQQHFGVIPGIPNDPVELENVELSLKFTRISEAFYEAEEKISALKNELTNSNLYITDKTRNDFIRVETTFRIKKKQFLEKLRYVVKEKDDVKIKEWLVQLKTDQTFATFFSFSENTVEFVGLKFFTSALGKLRFFKMFTKDYPQIKYTKLRKDFEKEMGRHTSGELVYVLFYRMDLYTEKDDSWIENFDLMTQDLTGVPYNKLILMDCDFEDELCNLKGKIVIHLYRNSQIISTDVLKEWNHNDFKLWKRVAWGSQIKPSSLVSVIESHRLTNWGEWGPWEYCLPGANAVGFRIKTDPVNRSPGNDNTGLNGISLECSFNVSEDRDSRTNTSQAISSEGSKGTWGIRFTCTKPSLVHGFDLRSLRPLEHAGSKQDEFAACNLFVVCDNDTAADADGLSVGEWTGLRKCPPGTVVCGLRTQVQKEGSGDHTGLNNVDMACCSHTY